MLTPRRASTEEAYADRRALTETGALSELLGGPEGEKRVLLDILDRHRVRLDRLGIEPVEEPSE